MTSDRPELQDRFPRTVERGLRRFACGGVTGRIRIIDSVNVSSTAIGPEFSDDFLDHSNAQTSGFKTVYLTEYIQGLYWMVHR